MDHITAFPDRNAYGARAPNLVTTLQCAMPAVHVCGLPTLFVGYRISDDERCITVFSAKNYTGEYDNMGAYLCYDASMAPKFHSF